VAQPRRKPRPLRKITKKKFKKHQERRKEKGLIHLFETVLKEE
jgi:hypothetical protein